MSVTEQEIEARGFTLGEEDGQVCYLSSTSVVDERDIDIATYLYCGNVDAGLFHTVVYNELGEVVEQNWSETDTAAVALHDFFVAKYIPGAEVEGLCTPIEEFAWFSQWKGLPWRPCFALFDVRPWGVE